MSDAVEHAEKLTQLALKQSLKHRKAELPYTGRCYNCYEQSSGVFFDADCRDDYEAIRRNQA